MAITVKCDGCGKAFKADERFIGKRMRCKSCGQVFTVAAEGDPGQQLSEDESLLSGIAEAASESTRGGVPAQTGYVPPVQIMSDDEPIQTRGIRRTQAFNFPFADALDAWAPRLIVLGGLGWLIFEALNSKYPGPVWVPLTRLALLLALFAIVGIPIIARGVELAARKFRFTFPPEPGWRTFATFFFPFVLGYVLWHVSGDVGSIVLGLVSGLIVSLGLFWFLFRMEPRELPLAFAYTAGSFLVAMLVIGGIVFGLNMLALNVMKGMRQAHHFAASPFGPTLAWDATPPPAEEEKKPQDNKAQAKATGDQPAKPRRTSAKTVDKTAAEPSAPVVPKPTEPKPAKPIPQAEKPPEPTDPFAEPANSQMANRQNSADSIFSDSDDEPSRPAGVAPNGEDSPPLTFPGDDIPVVGDESSAPVVGQDEGLAEGAITQVREIAEVGAFDDIVFPATPSNYFATIQRGPREDTIQLWVSGSYNREGIMKYSHDPNVRDKYILSPDGNYLLRITKGMRLAVQVFSFKDKKTSPGIDLNEINGQPSLVGFLNDDIFAVLWRSDQGKVALQTFGIGDGKQRKSIVLPNYRSSEGNFAIRKDGQQIAYVGRDNRGAHVELIALGASDDGRKIPIKGLGANAASLSDGIGFSPTNNKIAVVFEQGNQRVVMGWQLSTGAIPVIDEVFHLNRNASGDAEHAIGWFPDGNSLMVKGQMILSGVNGKPLADVTQLKNPIGQRVIDGQTVEVIVVSGQQKKLAVLTLDSAVLNAAGAKPAKPLPAGRP